MILQIATSSIMEIVSTENDAGTLANNATLHKDSSPWSFEKRPGMLYVVVRAVSVGTNGNGDHFTYEELKRAYQTFIGKGVFVNHQSSDVEKKRGLIVDAKFIDQQGPQNAYVKTVLEVNAEAFPELARMIKASMINSVSMGCQVAYSNCSICGHAAKTTKDYCFHVRMHKGGAYDGRPVYEENHGIEFIEVSFVTTGADAQAKVLEIIAKQARMTDTDVRKLWAQAALEPDFINRLHESQQNFERIIAAELEAKSMRTIAAPFPAPEEAPDPNELGATFKTDDGMVKDIETPAEKIETPEHIITLKIQAILEEAAELRDNGQDNSMVLARLDACNREYRYLQFKAMESELNDLLVLAEEQIEANIDCTATLNRADRFARVLAAQKFYTPKEKKNKNIIDIGEREIGKRPKLPPSELENQFKANRGTGAHKNTKDKRQSNPYKSDY